MTLSMLRHKSRDNAHFPGAIGGYGVVAEPVDAAAVVGRKVKLRPRKRGFPNERDWQKESGDSRGDENKNDHVQDHYGERAKSTLVE